MTPVIQHVLVTTAVLAVGSAAASGIFIEYGGGETHVDGDKPDGDHHDKDHHDRVMAAGGDIDAAGKAHPRSALTDAKHNKGKP